MRRSYIRRSFLRGLLAASAILVTTGCRFEEPRPDAGAGGSDVHGTGGGGGSAVEPLPLVVATWNVHNLVNDKIDTEAPFEVPDDNYVAHRKAVARVIDGLDADILVLQEVEHIGVLGELNEELDSPYGVLELVEGNDPRGVDIAVLSRLPIDKVVTHKNDEFTKLGTSEPTYKYARDCLELHIEHNGRRLVLLGVHYRSKENDDPDKRLAEAQRTRIIANSIGKNDPSAGVLVLGDFNDLPGSAPVKAVEGENPRYANAADHVPEENRWTFDYNGSLELVDHQFANPLLFDMLDQSSVQIVHGDEVWKASDHAPIVATYEIR